MDFRNCSEGASCVAKSVQRSLTSLACRDPALGRSFRKSGSCFEPTQQTRDHRAHGECSFVGAEPLGRKGLGAGPGSPALGGWTKAAFQPGFAELRSGFSSWKHTCQTALESPEASADPRGALSVGCDLPYGSPHSGLSARTLQQLQTPLLPESYRYRNREEQRGPGTAVSSPLAPVCPVSSFLMHRYSLCPRLSPL